MSVTKSLNRNFIKCFELRGIPTVDATTGLRTEDIGVLARYIYSLRYTNYFDVSFNASKRFFCGGGV